MKINGYNPYKKGFDMLVADMQSHEAEQKQQVKAELERLRKIEAAAVACTEYEQWTGDTFYDLMIELQKAIHEGLCTLRTDLTIRGVCNGNKEGKLQRKTLAVT